ncbi:MAG: Holliday junction resolvase RuvX [Deltaproteobacteria bacterium]|nr:Holliday junction resolvase RuvX [Deltaproteobacteria bacterium]
MRILALDMGSKTIGVALSDPLGWTAQGLKTVLRRGKESDYKTIVDLVKEWEVDEILIGLPINMNGTEGPQAEKVRAFASELGRHIEVPITFWDERLSTAGAERSLLEADLSRERRKEVIDKMAAAFILQGYLDQRRQIKKEEIS